MNDIRDNFIHPDLYYPIITSGTIAANGIVLALASKTLGLSLAFFGSYLSLSFLTFNFLAIDRSDPPSFHGLTNFMKHLNTIDKIQHLAIITLTYIPLLTLTYLESLSNNLSLKLENYMSTLKIYNAVYPDEEE